MIKLNLKDLVIQMVSKMELVVQLHGSFLGECGLNTKEIEKKYATRKGHIMFHSFGKYVWLKMHKPSKKKFLLATWEGPHIFTRYKDG
jgi:hypothetical protein